MRLGAMSISVRGGYQIPPPLGGRVKVKGGGGQTKMSEIQIETFKNPWGAGLHFQKCLNYTLLSDSNLKTKNKKT